MSLAVNATEPRTVGFHEHVTDSPEDCLLMHPAILFPLAKKVAFPSLPFTPRVAEIVKGVLSAAVSLPATYEVAEREIPSGPFNTNKKEILSILVVNVEPESTDSRILPMDQPESDPTNDGELL